ncbi:hypothetical protein ACFL4M_02405 [Pseudomonadota bacterium]
MDYKTADEWREAAMKRVNGVDENESARRREMVQLHQLQSGAEPDADTLADYELHILGKMDIKEYQDYLFFKHSKAP